ncbi:hypothetical protein I8J29_24415 [Paenibacillus sp. MWE-103]|uniref:Uncharacterized protein n=1 Tax=Paenibacillus artemisiicola TaxID=1172618 RepID=A0ABS3WG96_9BACL|nr:hypothetical protein [Paenibacillus artemisiicola]MBO7747333.1 hypothetical protein [Paenibacillus artemisiicola]
MPAYSTGVVTNTRDIGTAATTIVLNVSNIDPTATSVTVKIVASVDSDFFYTAYVSGFVVPAGGYEVMTFNIAGNVAYEVQVSTLSSSQGPFALVSVYGLDEFGNLVANQRFAPEELSSIPAIDLGA